MRQLHDQAGACALKCEPPNENAPFFFLCVSICAARWAGGPLEVHYRELPARTERGNYIALEVPYRELPARTITGY